jgi:hypothetical protein
MVHQVSDCLCFFSVFVSYERCAGVFLHDMTPSLFATAV